MSIKKALCRVGIILAVASAVAIGQTKGSVASVKIGDLTWTKQNVNVEVPGSWCYEDKAANCAKLGRLYTWEAAKGACSGMGSGWRLPDTADWKSLVRFAGGIDSAGNKLRGGGWTYGEEGTDDYGFGALPGGARGASGNYSSAGNFGYWWGSLESGSGTRAYMLRMCCGKGEVREEFGGKDVGRSVRCVRD